LIRDSPQYNKEVLALSINDTATGRNVNKFLRILAALQPKKVCPVNWQQGDATIG